MDFEVTSQPKILKQSIPGRSNPTSSARTYDDDPRANLVPETLSIEWMPSFRLGQVRSNASCTADELYDLRLTAMTSMKVSK